MTSCLQWLLLLWVACLAAGPSWSQTTSESLNAIDAPQRPKIALVLSGGGARGFAHIGVLKALEAARVPVDVIVGTSMGAIIGGLYASGMSVTDIEAELQRIDWSRVFSGSTPRAQLPALERERQGDNPPVLEISFRDGEFLSPMGAVSSRSLEWLLRRYTLGTRQLGHFDHLPIPFKAVATDMETGEPVVLEQGDLAAALRASMSVPGVFSPLEVNGRILGDGGLVDNLPVQVAQQTGATAIIAVNIGTPLAPRSTLNNVVGVTTQMINILTEQNVQRSIALLTPKDLLLTPPLPHISSASFDQATAIMALGHAYAQTVQASLERFAVSPAAFAQWTLRHRTPTANPEPQSLAFVRLEGMDPEQARPLQAQLLTRAGQPLSQDLLEQDLQWLTSAAQQDHVDYHLATDPATTTEGLLIHLRSPLPPQHSFGLGWDWHTNLAGDSGFNIHLTHRRRQLNAHGLEWNNRLTLGDRPSLETELLQPWGSEQNGFTSLHASLQHETIRLYTAQGQARAEYARTNRRLNLSQGWALGRSGQWGVARLGLFVAQRRADPQLINPSLDSASSLERWREQGLHVGWKLDQLDHAHFPTQGQRLALQWDWGRLTPHEQEHQPLNRLRWQATQVLSQGAASWSLHAQGAHARTLVAGALDEHSLGGFHQLSGFKPGQISGQSLGLVRLGYQHRLSNSVTWMRGLFAGATLEAGRAWKTRSGSLTGTHWGSSLYLGADTALGPVYLGLAHGQRQGTSLSLFLGRTY